MNNRYLLISLPALLMTLLLLPAIAIAQSPMPTPPAPLEGTPTSGSVGDTVNEAMESVAARTPIPTPTPGVVQREVFAFTQARGLDDVVFLGLSAAEWIEAYSQADEPSSPSFPME